MGNARVEGVLESLLGGGFPLPSLAEIEADERLYAESAAFEAEQEALQVAELKQPARALKMLQELAAWELDRDGARPHQPVEVLDVSEAGCRNGYRTSSAFFMARVRCDDGQVRTCRFESWRDNGDRYEPPSGEDQLTWTGEGGAA